MSALQPFSKAQTQAYSSLKYWVRILGRSAIAAMHQLKFSGFVTKLCCHFKFITIDLNKGHVFSEPHVIVNIYIVPLSCLIFSCLEQSSFGIFTVMVLRATLRFQYTCFHLGQPSLPTTVLWGMLYVVQQVVRISDGF